MSLRLFAIKSFLHFLVFVDFLEDIPVKVWKYVLRGALVTLLLVIYFTFVFSQAQSRQISKALTYLLVPKSRLINIKNDLQPILVKKIDFPQIDVKSLLVADGKENRIFYEINSEMPFPPASTTKLMTALIAMDLYVLNDYVEIPAECTLLGTQKVGFVAGERVSASDLIYSLLVTSAGDSACALARGKTSENDFVGLMNQKAQNLKLANTVFANPIGLDDLSNNHYSSAKDLLVLAKEIKKNDFLKTIVQTKEYNLTSGSVERKIFNTNDLLWDVQGTVGIKTGRTYGAGEVLVYEYLDKNKDIIIIVMGSEDRFGDTKKVLNWVIESYYFGA